MKMKYAALYELYGALTRMQDVSGFKAAWTIAKNLKNLQNDAEFFENQKIRLLRKYGREENGRVFINQKDEHYQDFMKEFTELSEMETEAELYKVKSDIEEKDIQCDSATAKDYLLFMEYLMEEPEKEKEEPEKEKGEDEKDGEGSEG